MATKTTTRKRKAKADSTATEPAAEPNKEVQEQSLEESKPQEVKEESKPQEVKEESKPQEVKEEPAAEPVKVAPKPKKTEPKVDEVSIVTVSAREQNFRTILEANKQKTRCTETIILEPGETEAVITLLPEKTPKAAAYIRGYYCAWHLSSPFAWLQFSLHGSRMTDGLIDRASIHSINQVIDPDIRPKDAATQMATQIVRLHVKAAPTIYTRTARIKITSGDMEHTVTITQKA